MIIKQALAAAIKRFNPISDSPQLDAQILLAHTLNSNQSYLFTWPEHQLSEQQYHTFHDLIQRRCAGEPIAYIVGYKEFWSLNLKVNSSTLIPRPETELLVELSLKLLNKDEKLRILELGTGSGAIAIALAAECPNWQITATDNSSEAFKVAQINAQNFQLSNINFIHSDWFDKIDTKNLDAIISNPPYIAQNDPDLQLECLNYEPKSALIASQDGLAALKTIIKTSPNYLAPNGYLILEHGYKQRSVLSTLMKQTGYLDIVDYKDIFKKDRVITGRIQGKC